MSFNEVKLAQRISGIENKVEMLSMRLNSNDALINTIHELASDIKVLTHQVKTQGERIEQIVLCYESKLKEQGKRISTLEKEPAHKWRLLISQIITFLAAALVGGVVGQLTINS